MRQVTPPVRTVIFAPSRGGRTTRTVGTPLHEVYAYERGWDLPAGPDRRDIAALMAGSAPQGGSAPPAGT
jgi:hypothetical protein